MHHCCWLAISFIHSSRHLLSAPLWFPPTFPHIFVSSSPPQNEIIRVFSNMNAKVFQHKMSKTKKNLCLWLAKKSSLGLLAATSKNLLFSFHHFIAPRTVAVAKHLSSYNAIYNGVPAIARFLILCNNLLWKIYQSHRATVKIHILIRSTLECSIADLREHTVLMHAHNEREPAAAIDAIDAAVER